VLMAEQNFEQAARIANRGYVLVHGQVVLAAESVADLRKSDVVRRLYLGTD
jgi:branched-chain amino acid transport system ATP-binding protein